MSGEATGRRSPAAKPARSGRGFVVTFHGIGRPARELDAGEERVWVEERCFEAMIDAVAARPDVMLTFDDGNRSDLSVAAPILSSRGLGGTCFVSVARLGRPGFLAAVELRALRDAGIEIGLHGFEHRSWRGLGDADLHREIEGARSRLEDILGAPVDRAACPFGAYDRRVLGALARARMAQVYTSDGGPAALDGWLVARTTVRSDWSPGCLLDALDARGRPLDPLLRWARTTWKRQRTGPWRLTSRRLRTRAG